MNDMNDTSESTGALDSVLRRGLQTVPLAPEAMERIRAATEAQWRVSVGAVEGPEAKAKAEVESSRPWGMYASAAAVVMMLLVGGLFAVIRNPAASSGTVLSRLEKTEYPGVVELHTWSHDRALANGEVLRKGQRILARGGARIALPTAGSLRVAAGTSLEVASDQLFKLSDGDIYVDVPPAATHEVQLVIETPAGTFTHVGTQFQLAVHAGQTEVRVREGQVRWSSAAGDVVAAAGTRIMIDDHGSATTGQIDTTGSDWVWAETLADAFVIDNRSLTEFLRYFARETGRKLVFADATVEQRADATKLHGSVQKLSQLDALSAVMATTSLRFTLDASSVRIESGGEVAAKIR
ncbi:MAG: FecR domain-containing protein [Pseudomonadota bacterium]